MLLQLMNTVVGFGKKKVGALLIGAAVLSAVPTAAFAGHRDAEVQLPVPRVQIEIGHRDDHDRENNRDRDRDSYRDRERDHDGDRVWVDPVYRTVIERVWVPAVTRSEMQHIEVAARYEFRTVMVVDQYGRAHMQREQVMVSPAHCEDVPVEVAICPGHYEEQSHQQLVCEGHWQEVEHARARFEIRLPF